MCGYINEIYMGFALLLFCLLVSILATSAASRIICPIQSLYQLGDSTSDTGNLIRISPVGPTLPAARLPYGETFPGRPTGRWSDGRLIIDFTASALGLPLLNPYFNRNASFENGVNFAVAGSTALNANFFTSRGIIVPPSVGSLDLQLSWFMTYLTSICSTPRDCANKLKKSLIVVGEIGGNDINYPLAQGKSIQEIQTYVPSINQAIVNTTREIIRAGASQIVVPGNFPIGCFPFVLSTFASNDSTAYDELGCLKCLNNLAIYQNNNLQVALNSLRREFPNVVILYADYYNAFLTLLRAASILGFDPTTILKPCCASRDFNPQSPQFCGGLGIPVCPDPNRYVHWDGIHLTQAAHNSISKFINGNILLKIKCFQENHI